MKLSVVICAHNPRPAYLARVFEALAAQTLSKEEWELLLIDNGSKPELSTQWDLSWHPMARHVFEVELGIAVARRRGMRSASADLILFVDDDNVLEAGYLSEILRIANEWPQLGVWGSGDIAPEFEVTPQERLLRLVPNLALRSAPRESWGNVLPCVDITPWGAGICMRKEVAMAYLDHCETSAIQLIGRQGGHTLMSGDDVEMSYIACAQGFGVGVFPSLKMTHLIPATRVAEDYLLGIFEGILASNYLLSFKWNGLKPPSVFGARPLLSLVKAALLSRGLDRRMYFANRRAVARARRVIVAAGAASREAVASRPPEALSARQ